MRFYNLQIWSGDIEGSWRGKPEFLENVKIEVSYEWVIGS